MAKSSARSKGYRNFNKQAKEAKNAKETKTMIIGLIAFAVIILLVFVGIKVADKIGTLPVKDGVIQAEESWIVRNMGTASNPRVYKMAEVSGPIEGFDMTVPKRDIRESQFHVFKATDENAEVTQYYMGMANGEYDEIAGKSYIDMASFGIPLYATEIKELELNGHKGFYYSLQYALDGSEAQDGSELTYYQCMNAYFDAKHKGTSLLVSVGDVVADENSFASDEALMEVLEKAFAKVTLQ